MKRRYRNTLIALLLTGAWLIAPQIAFADNCSSLNDCYYTLRAALAAAVGLGVFAALMAIGLDMGPLIGNLKGKFKGLTGAERAGGGSPDIWDRSLGVVPVGDTVTNRAIQEKRLPDQGMGASEQGQPRATDPAGQERMSQAVPRAEGPGDTGRTVQEPAAGDRMMEELRVESDRGSGGQVGGRSGERPGETGERATGVSDGGDVADRAEDVAEAFDEPERMTQASKQASSEQTTSEQATSKQTAGEQSTSEQAEASSQTAPPRETPQQSFKSADSSTASEPGARPQPASEQGSPPQEVSTAGSSQGIARSDAAVVEPGNVSASSAADAAADLMRVYADLSRVPGVRFLLQQMAANSVWAARGAAAQMGIARALGQQGVNVTRVEDIVEGRLFADIVVEDGAVVEVKDYYWAGPFFQHDENVADATRRLVRQVELLRRRYEGRDVRVAFSDLVRVPRQTRFVLHSIGIEVAQFAGVAPPHPQDVAGESFLTALRSTTVEEYWSRLVTCGWVSEADNALQARVHAAFSHDSGSAWLALAVHAFDAESIFETNPLGESYAAHIQTLSGYSQGALQPIRIIEEVQGDFLNVAFENGGRRYESRAPANSDYFALSVLDSINEAIAHSGEQRRFIPLPAPDQMIYLAFVSETSHLRAREAGLVPTW